MIAAIIGAWATLKNSKWMMYVLTALGAAVAVLAVVAKIFGAGKAAERAEAQKQIIKDVEKRHEIDTAVERDPDPAGSLRNKWSRD